MGELQTSIARRVAERGAAAVARELDVSRAAFLSYVAGASRAATREFIERRVARLGVEPPPGGAP